jgi:ribosomal protein S6
MKNYELAYLINPNLPAEEIKTLSEKMAGFVSDLGGMVMSNIEPEKRKLGYPIKKKIEAFLASLNFSLSPEKIKDLKEKILSEKEVLRYIIVAKMKESKKVRKIRKPQPMEKNPSADGKVEIEKINEKIDEILS